MHDKITLVDKFSQESLVRHRVDPIVQLRYLLKVTNVFHTACGQIIQYQNLVTSREERLCKVRADKSRTPGN